MRQILINVIHKHFNIVQWFILIMQPCASELNTPQKPGYIVAVAVTSVN